MLPFRALPACALLIVAMLAPHAQASQIELDLVVAKQPRKVVCELGDAVLQYPETEPPRAMKGTLDLRVRLQPDGKLANVRLVGQQGMDAADAMLFVPNVSAFLAQAKCPAQRFGIDVKLTLAVDAGRK
ncbi:MAG TPA: hypothetical protein VFK82_06575 [Burkholderiaceae bacterium]|nr:hypothetical protein [Burkholderiaceae bacterium]